jgi:hypothetical protein
VSDDEARRERARERRRTWTVETLTEAQFHQAQPWTGGSLAERLERLERLRRIAFALAGVGYPEGPTPKHERERWPVERIT